ncbi:MAG: hypothetical protein JWM16_6338 [Verrucomicrobiales bacterium]|nr:hypothetical protein [Verrucomicrobiales bacterium]
MIDPVESEMEPAPDAETPAEDTAAQQMSPADALMKLINEPNIVTRLPPEKLSEIADRVCSEYEIDDNSRETWMDINKSAMDLAMLVAGETKTYPFDKASNVKYPLLTTAALQFSARAYPAIVPGERVVKCKTNGKDPDGSKAKRAERVSEFTSWQLLEEMPEWEPDTDKLLVILPIAGCVFRKKYWDPALGRQVSRLVTADRLVVNYRARSLEDAPRVTERMWLYPYEIAERILDGRFATFEYGAASPSEGDDKDQNNASDDDAPHLFLEQHRLWDLDGDGYPEPYIVTVHKESATVCRIVANYTAETVRMDPEGTKVISIRKRDFYVKYGFLPSPDGGFYELGFGWLLKDNNEAINSTLNMMLDAGHVANVQGGFVSTALGIKEKTVKLKMGEYKVINTQGADLRQSIMPINFPGPSDTLFKLLGLLVEMGKEVASIKDVLSGEVKQNMQPTTVLALIDQGMQFFTAIYKRIHRSLKAELQIHSRLNAEHLTPETYNGFFDGDEQYDPQTDFAADMAITPASDPSVSSKMQKLAKAEFVLASAKDNPIVDQAEALKRYYEAADIEDIDKLIKLPPPPDPLMQMLGELEAQEKMTGITETLTKALLNIANAEAAEAGQQLGMYDMFLKSLQAEIGAHQSANPADPGQGQLPTMEGQPSDPMGAGAPGGAQPGDGSGAEGIPVPSSPPPQPGPAVGVPAA